MSIFEFNIFWITLAPTYYGLMYVLWFVFWYLVLKKRSKSLSSPFHSEALPLTSKGEIKETKKTQELLDDILLYMFGWIILWWRIWYMLFYNTSNLISDPLSLLKVWEWGMSFHGWVIWVVLAMLLFSKIHKINFYKLADEICLILPIWLFFGRIWNYINWELLWYSWYTWPLAINWQFPSPLLEAALEWVVLFGVLYYFSKTHPSRTSSTSLKKGRKYSHAWQLACLFLIWYSVFRIFVELFFREPDAHIWYILPYISLGTLLSIPMLMVWVVLYFRLWKK